jgi:hypothetical protein
MSRGPSSLELSGVDMQKFLIKTTFLFFFEVTIIFYKDRDQGDVVYLC